MWYAANPIFNATQQSWMHFLAYGSKAVPMFVCLSGYLIFRSVCRLHDLAGLKGYCVRRFLRIYPAYFLSVVLCILLGQTTLSTNHIIAELFMLRAIGYPYFANPVTWSLYVEVLFYILAPFLVLFTRKQLLILSCIAFVALTPMYESVGREIPLWRYFTIGILAAILVDHGKTWLNKEGVSLSIAVAGFILLFYDLGGFHRDWVANLGITGRSYLGFSTGLALACLLILVGSARSSIINAACNWLPIKILGVVSYSLFLFHFFFLWANFPGIQFRLIGKTQEAFTLVAPLPAWYLPFVVVPGLILWSMIFYTLVERPFLNMRPKRLAR